ncbi:hypothetical protein KUV95_17045 [Microbulbifer agarilyticus]|uniref:hypothetical protein n=1 Tax=Microbulbifer agarilyticus TaxID=260552 RepID=UPI001C94A5C8|nr:hypothetical protein [Microbulbifer agarilyticus]MBY6213257.1 hypothetical protein [Microbulbifer agarilyticus]
MERDERDPYKKEREEEYAGYKRLTIRAAPAFVCAYVIYANPYLAILDKARDLLIVAVMYGLVSYCYSKLPKDNLVFSISVLLAWSWLIYEWWFVEGVSFIGSFLPAAGLLLIISRVLIWHDMYKSVKERNT